MNRRTWTDVENSELARRYPDEPTSVVQSRKRTGYRPHITKAEREHTPPELAHWLVELAAKCKGHNAIVSREREAASTERGD